jgi:hypothetical protein
MGVDALANPYVGPRPFERADAPRFFGRAREVRDVASLIIAQRVLLLYSASGAGKSSLLNAGVLPVLEARGFDVLPVARVRAEDPQPDSNVFIAGLRASLDAEATGTSSLAQSLARRSKVSESGLRVLVIDQFEELFTVHPGRWQDRPALFDELRDALEIDPGLRIVLAIREDFLAQLDAFGKTLPGGLRTRFRLERLDRSNALAAVKNPLAGTRRSFAPGAAEALVSDLMRFRVDTGKRESEEFEGQYVEPVQLQVACRTLWADLPADVGVITTEHLSAYADVDQVLGHFYDDAMATAASRGEKSERRIREWVEETLITPGGTRGAAYAAADETAGMPTSVVQTLEEKRLIRADWRAGARWYELTHDRLIAPIRKSNAAFRSALIRKRMQRLAVLIAVAAALAAGGIAYLSATSGGKETTDHSGITRCTDCLASVSTPVVEPNVSYERWLKERGLSTVGIGRSTLRRNGVVIRFTVHLVGKGSFRQSLAVVTASGLTVNNQSNGHIVSSAGVTSRRLNEWVPVPVTAGAYSVQIRVYAPGALTGDVPIAFANTSTFHVNGKQLPPATAVTISVVKLGNGNGRITGPGIDCGQICSAQFAAGRKVMLQASPSPGSFFQSWNGICHGTDPCTVAAGAVTSVAATFNEIPIGPFVNAIDRLLTNSAKTRGDLGRLIQQVSQSGTKTSDEARSEIAALIARRRTLQRAVRHLTPPLQFEHAYSLLQRSITLSLDDDYAIRDWIAAKIAGNLSAADHDWNRQLRASGQASAAKTSFLTVYNGLRRQLLHLQPITAQY